MSDCLYRHYLNPPVGMESEDGKLYSFMHYITLILSLGQEKGRKLLSKAISHSWLYHEQMFALTVATNWEVQETIRSTFENMTISEASSKPYLEILKILYLQIDNTISNINAGSNGYPAMLQSKLVEFFDCLQASNDERYIEDVERIFLEIERIMVGERAKIVKLLCGLYKAATKVNEELEKAKMDAALLPTATEGLAEFLKQFNETVREIDNKAFHLNEEAFSMPEEVQNYQFWLEFRFQFQMLCDVCGIGAENVIAQSER